MTILDKIVAHKHEEIKQAKKINSVQQLQEHVLFTRTCYSLKDSFAKPNRNGIIAEFKRASPSKGLINGQATVSEVVSGYQASNVSAVSVLTDSDFFQGDLTDLVEARKNLQIPLLRKEFIIDPYQIIEAKAYGADIILLIAACLEQNQLEDYAAQAQQLGMSVLLEVHNEEELQKSCNPYVDAIGVNNRNLKDFTVSLEHSYDLVNKIPSEYIKVSESGISDANTINELREKGFQGFLIGENFMRNDNPAQAISKFIKDLR